MHIHGHSIKWGEYEIQLGIKNINVRWISLMMPLQRNMFAPGHKHWTCWGRQILKTFLGAKSNWVWINISAPTVNLEQYLKVGIAESKCKSLWKLNWRFKSAEKDNWNDFKWKIGRGTNEWRIVCWIKGKMKIHHSLTCVGITFTDSPLSLSCVKFQMYQVYQISQWQDEE